MNFFIFAAFFCAFMIGSFAAPTEVPEYDTNYLVARVALLEGLLHSLASDPGIASALESRGLYRRKHDDDDNDNIGPAKPPAFEVSGGGSGSGQICFSGDWMGLGSEGAGGKAGTGAGAGSGAGAPADADTMEDGFIGKPAA